MLQNSADKNYCTSEVTGCIGYNLYKKVKKETQVTVCEINLNKKKIKFALI